MSPQDAQAAASRRGRPAETTPPPTVQEVLALAQGLPFTKSVLHPVVEEASASQRRFLHRLFTQEQQSRESSKRARLIRPRIMGAMIAPPSKGENACVSWYW